VFQRWLRAQEKPAPSSDTAGAKLFQQASCANCHAIRGTSASGYVGPDLTHVGSRSTLAALTIPNDRSHLLHWIVDAQDVKPGNQMPNIRLTNQQAQTLATYLEGLK
jgi:cytochrome c oxidase subunit 2